MPSQSDQQSIQGLWKLVSIVSRGSSVCSGATHYQFDGDRLKTIDPTYVDKDEWAGFVLDTKAEPKRLTETREWPGKGGATWRRVDRMLYELKANTLRICRPNVFGDYPDVFSEQEHSVATLVRDPGPPPQAKQPSGTLPVDDDLLGRLTWDDDFDCWEGMVTFHGHLGVELQITPDVPYSAELMGAKACVSWLLQNEGAARKYAAGELLELYNDAWRTEGEAISDETFSAMLTLENISIEADGSAELAYDDGELFGGHCVAVSLNPDRTFRRADIEG